MRLPRVTSVIGLALLALLGACEVEPEGGDLSPGKADDLYDKDTYFVPRGPARPLAAHQLTTPLVVEQGDRVIVTTDDLRYVAPIGSTVLGVDRHNPHFGPEFY